MGRFLLLGTLAVLLFIGGLLYWRLKPRPYPANLPKPSQLQPGNRVDLLLGRQGVGVEYDMADPVEDLALYDQQGLIDGINYWSLERERQVVALFDRDRHPQQVRVKTRYREESFEVQADEPRSAFVLRSIPLKLPPHFHPSGFPDTELRFSPDGRLLAIGSADGGLQVFPVAQPLGASILQKKIPVGIVKSLCFSHDGSLLIAGEQSPDGLILGFDAATGTERWRFRLADELGTSTPSPDDPYSLYTLPACMQLMTGEKGQLFALGLHSWGEPDKERPEKIVRRALSRVYALDAHSGRVLWKYPPEAPLDRSMTRLIVSADGSRVLVSASIPGAHSGTEPPGSLILCALDGATGAETGRLYYEPLEPFKSAGSWQALSITPDGTRGLLGANDGRLWAYSVDAVGKLRTQWQQNLGTPIEASGLKIYCSIGWSQVTENMGYATVGMNIEPYDAKTLTENPPSLHPFECSLHAFDLTQDQATRSWRYDLRAQPQGLWLSPERRWLGLAYRRSGNKTAQEPPEHGVLVFDLSKTGSGSERLMYRYPTEGPVYFQGTFSPDGQLLAIAEGPRMESDRMSHNNVYRVLLLH